jgi:hypothetical protein
MAEINSHAVTKIPSWGLPFHTFTGTWVSSSGFSILFGIKLPSSSSAQQYLYPSSS